MNSRLLTNFRPGWQTSVSLLGLGGVTLCDIVIEGGGQNLLKKLYVIVERPLLHPLLWGVFNETPYLLIYSLNKIMSDDNKKICKVNYVSNYIMNVNITAKTMNTNVGLV